MRVHKFVHFSQITGIVIVIQVGETNEGFLYADYLVMLSNLGERVVILVVSEKELGVFVSRVVR